MTTATDAATAIPITRPTAAIRRRTTSRRRGRYATNAKREGPVHDDALCDGDGGGSLGLRLCPCTSPHERLAPPGAWHDVSARHSQCAGRANRNSPGRDRARNAGREPDHIRRGARDRRAVRRRFVGACCHGKFDDGSIYRAGKSDDGSVCRHGKLGAGTAQHRALRRRRHECNGADDLCRVCDGICALGLVHGARVNGGPGRNSARFDRSGRRRPQPSVRCSKPESVGTRYELADAPQRHDAALDSVGVGGADTHMRDDPDRCPYDRGSADDVRSAFDRLSPKLGSDALPLIRMWCSPHDRSRCIHSCTGNTAEPYAIIWALVVPSEMEDPMCWEVDYKFFAEQKKAQDARIKQEQRAGVIDRLLNDANTQGEKPEVEATPVKEVAPAK